MTLQSPGQLKFLIQWKNHQKKGPENHCLTPDARRPTPDA
jgi:hypothetical protein